MTTTPAPPVAPRPLDGPSLAALLAAGIGVAGLGLIVLMDAADALSVPTLYAPAGGVSGRTTFGVVVWLVAWAILHRRWRSADPGAGRARRVGPAAVTLVAFGLLATFPPIWEMF